jgi:hypothetical protein
MMKENAIREEAGGVRKKKASAWGSHPWAPAQLAPLTKLSTCLTCLRQAQRSLDLAMHDHMLTDLHS